VAEVDVESLAIAIVSVGELLFGAYRSSRVTANLERVRAFLTDPGPEVLPVGLHAVECFGRFKADLRKGGNPIGDIDLFIAGVAVSHELKLVTNNTRHFERISEVSLENWIG
jgi:tRNA(fMet)-specific endonuclease VapC